MPIIVFEGKVGVDAPGIVSVNSSDWNEIDNVLFSYGIAGHEIASFYDFTICDWLLFAKDPQGKMEEANLLSPDVLFEPGVDPESLLGSGDYELMTLSFDLDAITGPVDTECGDIFTSVVDFGAVTQESLEPGMTTVATLSLQIASVEGVYTLTFADGSFVSDPGNSVDMDAGLSLEITVPAN